MPLLWEELEVVAEERMCVELSSMRGSSSQLRFEIDEGPDERESWPMSEASMCGEGSGTALLMPGMLLVEGRVGFKKDAIEAEMVLAG
jgi:hypothetical protein